jgi:hypothetical protein
MINMCGIKLTIVLKQKLSVGATALLSPLADVYGHELPNLTARKQMLQQPGMLPVYVDVIPPRYGEITFRST